MNFYVRRFNLYLLVLAVASGGCASDRKKHEHLAGIRVHVETAASLEGKTVPVRVIRDLPVEVVVDNDPVLTEQNLIAATLLETEGGFAVRVKFDETGTWMLEQATAENPGKHLAIFGQWGDTVGETRWLAAPLINRRIDNGMLTFTPDASREEAQKWVEGLNRMSKLLNTGKDK